jgi:hypothetical protein
VRDRKERRLNPWEFDLQLFGGSSAGGNFVLNPILHLNPNSTALSSPLTQYGTIGGNDTGLILVEARFFTKWGFMMCPEEYPLTQPNNRALPTNYAVTIYYTISKVTFKAQTNQQVPYAGPIGADGSTLVPVGSWWPLPASSDQSGTASDANPITSDGPVLAGSRFATGFRAVLTAVTGTPTAGVIIYGGGVP